MSMLRRTIHPQVRVLDEANGTVEYIASDESIDSYREVVLASGWKFDSFARNAPFVDSHDYSSVKKVLGKVVDYRVDKSARQLVETVQWAVDVPENDLAQLGWRMTKAGYLRAVSVGFIPVRQLSPFSDGQDKVDFLRAVTDLKLDTRNPPRAIYAEQQQVELSAVVVGANPNAVARAYKAGVLDDSDIDKISSLQTAGNEHATIATDPGEAMAARRRAQLAFMLRFQQLVKGL